jgi:hypothetical protein
VHCFRGKKKICKTARVLVLVLQLRYWFGLVLASLILALVLVLQQESCETARPRLILTIINPMTFDAADTTKLSKIWASSLLLSYYNIVGLRSLHQMRNVLKPFTLNITVYYSGVVSNTDGIRYRKCMRVIDRAHTYCCLSSHPLVFLSLSIPLSLCLSIFILFYYEWYVTLNRHR